MIDSEKFSENVQQKESCMYVVYIMTEESLLNTFNILLKTEKVHLSSLYKKYKKMFSESEVNKLSLHKEQDHEIILKDEQLSFKLLYNLFVMKLQVLQKYIKNNLIKSLSNSSCQF